MNIQNEFDVNCEHLNTEYGSISFLTVPHLGSVSIADGITFSGITGIIPNLNCTNLTTNSLITTTNIQADSLNITNLISSGSLNTGNLNCTTLDVSGNAGIDRN